MREGQGKAAARKSRKTSATPAPKSSTRLRAEIGTLQRRLNALNSESDGNAQRLLGDAARFLGAALARLQEADHVIGQHASAQAAPAPHEATGEAQPGIGDSEGLFQSAFRHAATGMAIVSLHARFVKTNPALCALLGYTDEELCGSRVFDFTHPDDLPPSEALAERLRTSDVPFVRLEKRYVRKDGSSVWGALSLALVRGANGEPRYFVAQVEDVGERRAALTALSASEQQFRTSDERFTLAVEGANDGIWDWHFDSDGMYYSARLCAILGFTVDEIVATPQSFYASVHPDDRDRVAKDVYAHIGGRTPQYASEYRIQHRDGTYRWVLARGLAVRGADGLARRMAGSMTDITLRKEAEQALRESEGQFRTLAETVTAATFIFQGETLRYVNPSASRITGYSRDELMRMSFWDVIHPDFRGLVRERGMARQRGEALPSQYEVKLQTKSGEERWVQFTAGMITFEGQVAVLGTAFDITDRKCSEEALRASEAKNKAILDVSPDTFIRVRRDGSIVDVKGDTSSWRTPAGQVLGRNLCELLPSDLALPGLRSIEKAVASGQMQSYEFEAPTAHGPLRLEARIVACGGDDAVCSIRDITARRHAEQEARQRLTELAHVARVSTMGEMAAALAHELNQPLMAIVGFASGCALRLESDTIERGELQGALRHVSQQAVRAGEILRRLRDFVRKGPPQRITVDVNDLVREVAGLADVDARDHRASLRLELDPTLPAVACDPIQVEQVMLNLIRNGIEAMSDIEGPRLLRVCTRCEGGKVAVSVSDSGRGFGDSVEELFEPFATTKPKGLGLGLSISRSIVEAHGGRLSAWRDDKPATTFQFTLPVARGGSR